jgi:hypothetical protein
MTAVRACMLTSCAPPKAPPAIPGGALSELRPPGLRAPAPPPSRSSIAAPLLLTSSAQRGPGGGSGCGLFLRVCVCVCDCVRTRACVSMHPWSGCRHGRQGSTRTASGRQWALPCLPCSGFPDDALPGRAPGAEERPGNSKQRSLRRESERRERLAAPGAAPGRPSLDGARSILRLARRACARSALPLAPSCSLANGRVRAERGARSALVLSPCPPRLCGRAAPPVSGGGPSLVRAPHFSTTEWSL